MQCQQHVLNATDHILMAATTKTVTLALQREVLNQPNGSLRVLRFQNEVNEDFGILGCEEYQSPK
jgi:hypothetical protein